MYSLAIDDFVIFQYTLIEIFLPIRCLDKSHRGWVCDPNVVQNVALHWGREGGQQEFKHKKFPDNFKQH